MQHFFYFIKRYFSKVFNIFRLFVCAYCTNQLFFIPFLEKYVKISALRLFLSKVGLLVDRKIYSSSDTVVMIIELIAHRKTSVDLVLKIITAS